MKQMIVALCDITGSTIRSSRSGPVIKNIADNLEPVGTNMVAVTLAKDFPKVIIDLVLRKVQIAIVSQNTSD